MDSKRNRLTTFYQEQCSNTVAECGMTMPVEEYVLRILLNNHSSQNQSLQIILTISSVGTSDFSAV